MLLEDLLDKDQRQNFDFLKTMQRMNPRRIFDLGELKQQEELSDFLIDRYISALNEDWQTLFDRPLFRARGNELMLLQPISSYQVSQYECLIKQRSATYNMLDELFKENFNIDTFCEEFYVSRAQAYILRRRVQALLQEYGIKIRNDKLIGEEFRIRGLMLGFYIHYEEMQKKTLDGHATDRIEKLKQLVIDELSLSITRKQEKLLEIFLTNNELRNRRENFLKTSIGEIQLSEEKLAAFEKKYVLFRHTCIHEISYLAFFLYAFDLTEEIPFGLECPRMTEVRELNRSFIELIQIEDRLNETSIKGFFDDLTRIHCRCLVFEGVALSYPHHQIHPTDPVMALAPEVREFIESNERLEATRTSEKEDQYLLEEYLLLLGNYVDLTGLNEPIRVCVDFIRGENFNETIERRLTQMSEYPILVQTEITEETDLYLSDSWDSSCGTKQLVWSDLPNDREWVELLDALQGVLETRKER